jgi:hypothetical protein
MRDTCRFGRLPKPLLISALQLQEQFVVEQDLTVYIFAVLIDRRAHLEKGK